MFQTGGPSVQIPTGRRDGRVSAAANVRPNIIDTSFTLDEMAKLFSAKGLSMDDLVTLSGTHTTIRTRFCPFQAKSNVISYETAEETDIGLLIQITSCFF